MKNRLKNISLSLNQFGKKLIRALNPSRVLSKRNLAAIIAVALFQYLPFSGNPLNLVSDVHAQTESTTTLQFQLPHDGVLTQKYSSYHQGIDIAAPLRTPIRSVAEGTVKVAGFNYYGLGLSVQVEHPNGYSSVYAHMGKIYVKVGQQVTKDDFIGEIGLTGNTTGPHTHLEILKDGVKINPLTVLPNPTGSYAANSSDLPRVISSVGGGLSQLPKTGLPVLGLAFLGVLPFGWRLRKVGSSINHSSSASGVWETRQFKK